MISLRSKVSQKILDYFLLQQGSEIYVNELARNLDIESGNLARKLLEMEKEGILRSRWQGKQRYYALNSKFPLINAYKAIILKTVGFEHTLKTVIHNIEGIEQAIIFGSYASDQMDAYSDIDLLVVGNHSTIELQKAVAQIQKKAQRDINVISMSAQEFNKKRKEPLLKSIVAKKNIRLI